MGLAPLTTTVTALAPRETDDHDGTPPAGSLTTIWSASPGCYPVSTSPTVDIDQFWSSRTQCGPPGYISYFDIYYYSPAICPSGFTVGCSRYGSFQGPPVEPTETAMLCVMSGYFCTPGSWNYYATNTELSDAQIMIQIRWAESDLSILETHPLTPGLKLVGVGSGSGTETGQPTDPTVPVIENTGDEGGLSTGAQVGIGVGVGLAGLLAIGLALFFILRYRKKKQAGENVAQKPLPGQYPTQQYPFTPGPGQPGQPGLQGYPSYPGYTAYVDPNTGVVSYYSSVPQATEMGDSAAPGSTVVQSQGTPSVAGSQSAPAPRRESMFSVQSTPPAANLPGDYPRPSPVAGELDTTAPALAEMPGSEGAALSSVGGADNLQAQQEMAYLMAEQAKLDARRTRLMEMAELDEEEQRIRTRMQQLQQTQ
ncbi:hypothetical protein GGS23DRAFT_202576 [Durotheca rogersii]|uniref:uncharacterized protein n=1 Tax=Durotheca rogersii TaxID=419775 RepID=UPI002220E5AF|nr:uncharacterized protein GGS23DRAFT_202576 [Durotheca rogersii]KAI5860946.1 hypothetical protein GGS23DRAFT_202576 [Durotheca rogersii]